MASLCNPLDGTHHDPGVLPLGELVEDAQQVDAGEHVSPAVHCTKHQQIRTEVHSKQQANRLMQENMFRQQWQYTAQNTSKLEQRATASNKPID
jgi:hypothetical protein